MSWKVGDKVAVFGPYDREPRKTARIEKVHKTGHIVVDGRRYRPGVNRAHETGRESWRSGYVEKLTAENIALVIRARRHQRIAGLAAWLARADKDSLPDSLLDALDAARKAQEDAAP